jgi:hypothetical protein
MPQSSITLALQPSISPRLRTAALMAPSMTSLPLI